jgi:hypothetical protein
MTASAIMRIIKTTATATGQQRLSRQHLQRPQRQHLQHLQHLQRPHLQHLQHLPMPRLRQ